MERDCDQERSKYRVARNASAAVRYFSKVMQDSSSTILTKAKAQQFFDG
eukprot:SAG22_NODE_12824_length_428_cov_0.659574_1_plen_48_part_10